MLFRLDARAGRPGDTANYAEWIIASENRFGLSTAVWSTCRAIGRAFGGHPKLKGVAGIGFNARLPRLRGTMITKCSQCCLLFERMASVGCCQSNIQDSGHRLDPLDSIETNESQCLLGEPKICVQLPLDAISLLNVLKL